MALLYHSLKINREHKEVLVRPIDDGDYSIAITFPEEEGDDENTVTELLLTEGEVKECYDLLFNR